MSTAAIGRVTPRIVGARFAPGRDLRHTRAVVERRADSSSPARLASFGSFLRGEDGKVYEGWLVVAAAASVVSLIAGFFFYGLGTFFTEFQEEFAWSAAATSIGFSLRSEVGGIAAPLVGWALDRYPPRHLLRAGLLLSALGCVAMSYISQLWHFYAAMLMIAGYTGEERFCDPCCGSGTLLIEAAMIGCQMPASGMTGPQSQPKLQ